MSPLRAVLDGGDFIANNLTEENRSSNYQCPFCFDKFVPVIPSNLANRRKFFRHTSGTTDHFSEPETIEHIELKHKVHLEAQMLGWKPSLEIAIGSHITDVTLEGFNNKIAVECQCSPISIEEYRDRNSVYRHNGFANLWIFSGSHFDHITNQTIHKRGYKIQRLHDIHELILKQSKENFIESNLYIFGSYLGRLSFYQVTSFQKRYNAKKLGWYHIQQTSLSQILTRYRDD